jgi:hypothetical protein
MASTDISSPKIDHFIALGAGASFGARDDVPRCARPPLGRDLADYLLHWLEANEPARWDRETQILSEDEQEWRHPLPCDMLTDAKRRKALRHWLSAARGLTRNKAVRFEKAVGKSWRLRHGRLPDRVVEHLLFWSPAQELLGHLGLYVPLFDWRGRASHLLEDLNWLITWALSTGEETVFGAREDLYDATIKELGGVDGLGVISLNYDVLFEEAIGRVAGKDAVWYPGVRFGQSPKCVPVYKLHGSCNWLTLPNVQVGAGENWQPDPDGPGLAFGPDQTLDTQQEHAVTGCRRNLVAHLKHGYGRKKPVMALYAFGKPAPNNWPGIEAARRACFDAIAANGDARVTAIGVHVPTGEDDATLADVLHRLGKLKGKRLFVNPSDVELDAARDLGFEGSPWTLRQYLRHMNRQRQMDG